MEDNEGLGRKSSKRCCIFHKPRAFGESSTDSSDNDSVGSESSSSSGGGFSSEKRPKDKKNRRIYQAIISNLALVERGLDSKLAAISTCDRLIPFNKKNFEEYKSDPTWLKRAVNRMFNKECTDDPFYDTLVEAYVKAEPSPNASVFYAGILMKKGETNK